MTASLDGLVEAAHRTSLQLFAVAGVMSGLMVGLGVLLLVRGEPGIAVVVWGLAVAVGGTISLTGAYLRRSAAITFQLGQELADQAAAAQHRGAAHAHDLGELRTQIAMLQRTVTRLERGASPAPLPPATAPEPVVFPDEGSLTGAALIEEFDVDTVP